MLRDCPSLMRTLPIVEPLLSPTMQTSSPPPWPTIHPLSRLHLPSTVAGRCDSEEHECRACFGRWLCRPCRHVQACSQPIAALSTVLDCKQISNESARSEEV